MANVILTIYKRFADLSDSTRGRMPVLYMAIKI